MASMDSVITNTIIIKLLIAQGKHDVGAISDDEYLKFIHDIERDFIVDRAEYLHTLLDDHR